MSDYIEYGEDWEKQMMCLSKKELIIFLRQNVSRIEELEALTDRQIHRTGQLTSEVDSYLKYIKHLETALEGLKDYANEALK
ncbi:MAG: hypothetical protein O7D95_02940 [Betaproteobacteria bacterium]|nr:hypothetical protein [Betaproteobacteria bacterium]